jgi:2-polyprenyl-3-methyl-5-hydroxy-6-metoxy-1,4-benzoquinol methylase
VVRLERSRPRASPGGLALNPNLATRRCPVCGSTSSSLLYEQRFESFRHGSIADGYDVVACDECGACFASGLPDQQRFDQYYADSSKYDLSGEGAQLSAQDLERFADEAAFVAAHISDRDSPALDVGTATGAFLAALRSEGFEHTYGVDPSPDAVRFARDELGLDVVVGGLDAAEAWGRAFGLVSWLAVLEHVLEPRVLLRATSRLLHREGHVFVSVPDAGSFQDHTDAPFQEFSVEHINFFTSRSLANLMAAEGYTLVAERSVVLPLGADGRGPALEAVYRWDAVAVPMEPSHTDADSVREYIRRCVGAEARTHERIAGLASSGERIFVWGTGTHTLHLLQTSRLRECAIEAFIDSNPHYTGATLAGRPVLAPSQLASVDAPILVSSAVSQTGIAAAARERFGPEVPLILLYGEVT